MAAGEGVRDSGYFPTGYLQEGEERSIMLDLHIHTNASSDAQHPPAELLAMCRETGLKHVAFADHNGVGSLSEAIRLAPEYGIDFIPAVEFNSYLGVIDPHVLDLHVLAYGVDPTDTRLLAWLTEIEREKVWQSAERLKRFQEIGFALDEADMDRFSEGRTPTGASYLKALLSRSENEDDPRLVPYLSGKKAASPYYNFYRDFLRDGPAFIPLAGAATPKVVARIRQLGAVAVLAHPAQTADSVVEHLVEAGLQGLEVYCNYHDTERRSHFLALSRALGLLATAGSDFHGTFYKPDIKLGSITGGEGVSVERLKEAMGYSK
ncbi:MAG: PHP domain-containing protein [Pseudomonadota bacterium]